MINLKIEKAPENRRFSYFVASGMLKQSLIPSLKDKKQIPTRTHANRKVATLSQVVYQRERPF